MKIPPRRLPGRLPGRGRPATGGTPSLPSPEAAKRTGFVRVGRIVGPFGLDGRLKIEPDTDYPARFTRGATVYIDGKPYMVKGCSWYRQQARLVLDGIDTVEQVEALRWKDLYVPVTERPTMAADEFYEADLIGCAVVLESGETLGAVDRILHAPAQDLLVVGEIMIPMVRQFVLQVDLNRCIILVRPIPGLLGDETEDSPS